MRQNEIRPEKMQSAGERGNGPGQGAAEPGNGASASQFNSDEIAARAYQIFEREGRMDGRDMDHWLQAEQELRSERDRPSGGANPQNAPRSARQHQQP